MDELFQRDWIGCRELLRERLAEGAPARIQLLTGPRQVGKTTLLLALADELDGTYAAADSPEAALPGFWEGLWARAESRAQAEKGAVLLIDEIQHMPDWAARLKGAWDRLRRRRIPLQVVASGSSALSLGRGSRESLAGRFELITMSHWTAAATAELLAIPPEEAAELVVRMGVYPGAMELRADLRRWTAYVRDAIVEPAIGRDILALADVRRPALLRQVFSLAASSPAQIVSLQKLQGQLQDPGALETLAHYLRLLQDAYLVAPLDKHSTKPLRRRAAPPKLVTLNNALMAAVDPRGSPDPTTEPARYGAWVENAVLAFAWNSGQGVSYWREEPLEIDGIFTGSWGSYAVEVKTGSFGTPELRGLHEFTRRFPEYEPLLLTEADPDPNAKRLGVQSMGWRRFLSEGPAGSRSRGDPV